MFHQVLCSWLTDGVHQVQCLLTLAVKSGSSPGQAIRKHRQSNRGLRRQWRRWTWHVSFKKSGHFYAVVMIGGLDTDICCSGCKCSLKPAADTDRWLMVFELTLCCIGAMRCSQLTLTSSVMGDQSTASDAKIASILHSKCWPLLPTNQHHERML